MHKYAMLFFILLPACNPPSAPAPDISNFIPINTTIPNELKNMDVVVDTTGEAQ